MYYYTLKQYLAVYSPVVINPSIFNRIQEPGHDPGFGQSILHEGQLVFHTPPYGSQDISLQEPANNWDIKGGTLKVLYVYIKFFTHSQFCLLSI